MAKIMENHQSTKDFGEKSAKLTLKGYYNNLPLRSAPRHNFIKEVVKRCRVTEQTVRNWILYGIKPQQQVHIHILSELSGVKEEDLW